MTIEDDILTTIDESGLRLASNAGRTRHRGIELGVGVMVVPAVRVDASLAVSRQTYDEWVAPVGTSLVDYGGKRIEDAPSALGNLFVTWTPGFLRGGRLSGEWSHVGSYWMDPDNTRRYDGHDLLNVQASYRLRSELELFGRVMNLTDERYAVTVTYNAFQREQYTPGAPRQLFVGARYSWER
jgi:outer membrane receptor protein involved in Fe transport